VNTSHPGADLVGADDADWARRVERAATADTQRLLRAARRRRRNRWLAIGLIVTALAVVTGLALSSGMFPVAGSSTPDPAVRGGTGQDAAMLDETRPFESTPAARWPDGAEGIVLPPAEPVAGFTAEQVAEATALVRDILVASRLDHRMLVEHDPATFLGLLAPDARRQLEPLFSAGQEPAVQSLVSLVSAESELLPAQAKVNGGMTISRGEDGALVVHTNYVFAYAFRPSEPTRLLDAMNVIVVVRADVDYALRWGDKWTPGSQGLWYGDASGYGYSIGCEAYRRGFLAPATTERAVAGAPAREPGAYFDPASPLPTTRGCQS
jgi:hypothetical protein